MSIRSKIRRTIKKIIPNWMYYHCFYSDSNRKFSYLRLMNDYFSVHPKLRINKIKYYFYSKINNRPLIGHIHIPKTGGSYTTSIKKYLPHINFYHIIIRTDRSDKHSPFPFIPMKPKWIKKYFLFSNIRNPLFFLRSYYHHVIGFGNHYNRNHYDYKNANKGFEYLVKKIINREQRWPSRKFLYPQLFNQSGDIIVNWINKTENLDNDLLKLCRYFGYTDFSPKDRKRVAPKKDIEDYYNDKLKEKVEMTYYREMELFGYEGYTVTDPIINLKPLNRNRVKYNYLKDELLLDGKKIQ